MRAEPQSRFDACIRAHANAGNHAPSESTKRRISLFDSHAAGSSAPGRNVIFSQTIGACLVFGLHGIVSCVMFKAHLGRKKS